jgi:hypothetical protein
MDPRLWFQGQRPALMLPEQTRPRREPLPELPGEETPQVYPGQTQALTAQRPWNQGQGVLNHPLAVSLRYWERDSQEPD